VLVKNYAVVGLHWGMYMAVQPALVVEAQRQIYRLYLDGAVSRSSRSACR
jgi:NADPH2:quinone reductase